MIDMLEMRFKKHDMLKHLDEFKELWENRPIFDNTGGMKSPHMFPAWYMMKKIKPKFLIESGVWKGLGTWFLQIASPDTKIISIDPAPQYRVWTSDVVDYETEDFLDIDWKSKVDPAHTLVFFDDHQNCLPRIKKCKKLGFKRIILEDNYPVTQGDCYKPKKILSQKDYIIDVAGKREMHQSKPDDFKFLMENLKVYQEMNPIFKAEITRWGDEWSGEDYGTPEPLLSELNVLQYQSFYLEKLDYTWICYMELK